MNERKTAKKIFSSWYLEEKKTLQNISFTEAIYFLLVYDRWDVYNRYVKKNKNWLKMKGDPNVRKVLQMFNHEIEQKAIQGSNSLIYILPLLDEKQFITIFFKACNSFNEELIMHLLNSEIIDHLDYSKISRDLILEQINQINILIQSDSQRSKHIFMMLSQFNFFRKIISGECWSNLDLVLANKNIFYSEKISTTILKFVQENSLFFNLDINHGNPNALHYHLNELISPKKPINFYRDENKIENHLMMIRKIIKLPNIDLFGYYKEEKFITKFIKNNQTILYKIEKSSFTEEKKENLINVVYEIINFLEKTSIDLAIKNINKNKEVELQKI